MNISNNTESKFDNFIDFDLSSKLWRENKKYLGKGVFRYKCSHISSKKNKFCRNNVFNNMLCKYHYSEHRKNNKINKNIMTINNII